MNCDWLVGRLSSTGLFLMSFVVQFILNQFIILYRCHYMIVRYPVSKNSFNGASFQEKDIANLTVKVSRALIFSSIAT
jgi:hypothetical protein